MAIYSRFGSKVKITGPVTTADQIRNLDCREMDDEDCRRIELGMYVSVLLEGSETERLYDLANLKADGGIREINEAARAVGCEPR